MSSVQSFKSINIRGKVLPLDSPRIMGILNVTPDSFYENSRVTTEMKLLEAAATMISEGADFLDVGGYSSRPGATDIDVAEELKRIVPAIQSIRKEFPGIIISIDTFRAEVAEQAVEAGAGMINDISGGGLDPLMFQTAARLKVPYVLMHMRGSPQTMAQETSYTNLLNEVNLYFADRLHQLKELGVNDVIVDPGLGFAKTVDQSFELLNHLRALLVHDRPLLAGLSRKSMIWKTLNSSPEHTMNGTTALNMVALMNGASILRVHDVKAAMEVVTLFNRMQKV